MHADPCDCTRAEDGVRAGERCRTSRWMTNVHHPTDGSTWRGSAWSWAEVALVRLAKEGQVDEVALCEERTSIDEVFGNAPLAATAYLYLCRRFGPPPTGCDGHKEFGQWFLTTPNERVVVSVYPRASSIGVGVMVPDGDERDFWQPPRPIVSAVVAALRDLLRPVSLRDSWLNVAGPCDPPECDEATGERAGEAPVFRWAGYGVEPDYWRRFEEAPVRTIDLQPGDVVWLGEWHAGLRALPDDEREDRRVLVWPTPRLATPMVRHFCACKDGDGYVGIGFGCGWKGERQATLAEAQADVERFVRETWGARP